MMKSVTIHETAIIDQGAKIGAGSRIWHWVHVCAGARIGENVSLGQNVFVGDNVKIGDNCKIQNNVSIYDNVTLEEAVFCGPSMVFTNVYNPRSLINRKTEYRNTYVEYGATLGANCTVVCGVNIGRFAFIAAGAVINKNVKNYALMAGVPAKQIGWMSENGARLALPLSGNADAECPNNGDKYKLKGCRVVNMEFCDLKAQYKALKFDMDAAIKRVVAHGKYILGPEVYELEEQLAHYTGSDYCITVANGTDALQIALMAANVGIGDEIIVPAFSYISTAEAAKLLGAKPVYVDINPHTFNIRVEQIEKQITPRTKAIVPVSLFGRCADFEEINKLATRNNLVVIEDAAQSFGATYKNKFSCNLSLIGCTSFFPSKPLGCYGDGGAIFTKNKELAVEIRKIARHGQSRKYYHERLGMNSRLDTLQAAVLLTKMKKFDWEIEQRQIIANRYTTELNKIQSISVPSIIKNGRSAWAQYTLTCSNRDQLQNHLHENDIPTAIYYPITLNNQPAVKNLSLEMPHSEKAAQTAVSLPFSAYLSRNDQDKVISSILRSFR